METLFYSFPVQFPSNKAPVLLTDGLLSEHTLHQAEQEKAHELGPAAPGQSRKEKGHMATLLRPTSKSHWGKIACSSCLTCTRKTWCCTISLHTRLRLTTTYNHCMLQDQRIELETSLRPGGGRYLRGGRRAELI